MIPQSRLRPEAERQAAYEAAEERVRLLREREEAERQAEEDRLYFCPYCRGEGGPHTHCSGCSARREGRDHTSWLCGHCVYLRSL